MTSSPQQPQSQQSQGSASSNNSLPNQQQQKPGETLDSIAKVKSLTPALRDALSMSFKSAAQLLQYNTAIDGGAVKTFDANQQVPRFEKHIEEFYSICDQIEIHLKTAMVCMQQNTSLHRYLPTTVVATRVEPCPSNENALAFPQYLSAVRQQIAYAKDLHETLICAAKIVQPTEVTQSQPQPQYQPQPQTSEHRQQS